ncbi:HAD-IIB family hydrolase [Aneurinibacillus aneurinilyticus]|uniref:HAD-IIB family hydrolase n=1 Tax=Aneurinibacillus aneurinilyticus TaxID=1391 RepID=UPI00058F48D3|nr:HAD-IIB family hydrolase [Aneurinibacillus aneurinilyticus]MED0704569.1 HAD-IIB family hydrolase [Aneurinibacillus aneurinilyticus]MED0725219.1 HAD-IIB family hydrolase [Aneurinibacillus aneurinilyticus]MED0734445.1 HAD-IIB family hydrolase [Aneurinibacillus aneurinilyticus]MED0742485.1 HAD-IIB family hydrolase [Aneurinibacillus aneurinilyticus]
MLQSVTHLLATDLDGTLVGDEAALLALLHYYSEQPYNVALIYSTGRHLRSALSLLDKENLPHPDILITDVGTEIYYGDNLRPDEEWQRRIEAQWSPAEIKRIALACEGLVPQDIPVHHRLSYTIQDIGSVVRLEAGLNEAGIPHKLIVSSGRDVDILPPVSGKGEALRYVLKTHGLCDANVLVAGDSGNDYEMITLGYPAVIVGNAQQELLALEEHPLIFRAKKACAGGIHEAWEHFYGIKNSASLL